MNRGSTYAWMLLTRLDVSDNVCSSCSTRETPKWYDHGKLCRKCYAARRNKRRTEGIVCHNNPEHTTQMSNHGVPWWFKHPEIEGVFLCIACKNTGKYNTFYKKKHTVSTLQKMSQSKLGKPNLKLRGHVMTVEQCRKISERTSGSKNVWYGMKRPEHSKRMSGEGNPMYNKHHTIDTRKSISEGHLAITGGRALFQDILRQKPEYAQWRKSVFERDDYTCQWPGCGERGGKLEGHHIVRSFSTLIACCGGQSVLSLDNVFEYSELWDEVNGITICRECHKKTQDYLLCSNRSTCQ